MLFEFFEYCLTPASRKAKQGGYLYEALAFQAKAQRNKKHWSDHWSTCHFLVESFLSAHPKAKSIAIFGSGCLFEIPKGKILERMDRIVLVDQIFPLRVRSWAKLHRHKIELLERDLASDFPTDLSCDLAISANLLSQMTLPLENANEKKTLEKKHFNDLTGLGTPVLLWTDVARIFSDAKTGIESTRERTVTGLLPTPGFEWIWKIAPAPECESSRDVSLKMQSFVW